MRRTIVFQYVLTLVMSVCSANNAFSETSETSPLNSHLHGSLQNETAYRIAHPEGFAEIKNQLLIAETGKPSEDLNFKISGRFYYDAVFDATDHYGKNVASDQKDEAELRDTYIDYSKGPFDFRLGKQQIVWGEAVGLFFADVVNAKDFREFILPDFDMMRIPDWSADIEYAKENFHAEFVWVPCPEFNKFGVTGSEFAFPYPVPGENIPFTAEDPHKPNGSFENGETGGRISYLKDGWDTSAFYLYTWDKTPVMFRTIDAGGTYQFHPRYERLNIIGGTFSKEINDYVFKGELVFNREGCFSTFDTANEEGITRKDYIDYVLGMDRIVLTVINTNIQFIQRVIFDYDNLMVNERKVNNSISFWANRGFLNNNLDFEFLVIASLMEKDLMYRPKLTYKFKNNWKMRLGLDIFQGEATGTFGKFEKKDRIYTELSYLF